MAIPLPTETAHSLIQRLRDHLCTQIDHQGRARSACCSRVLESALTCRLLERDPRHPTALARVRSYLSTARERDDLTLLDRALLGMADGDVLAGFDHHTAGRKRLLVDVILHAAGVRAAPETPPTVDARGSLQNWKHREFMACQAICARAARTPVAEDHLRTLAAMLDSPRIYEGYHLPHLLLLHALQPYPAYQGAVRHGLDLMVATQCADGGFSVAEHFDTWVTSVVAAALTEAGTEHELLARTGMWLANQQAPDGGWPDTTQAAQTDMDATYTTMAFLRGHDPSRYEPQLAAGRAYVRRMQNPDGGWPTYRRGNPSEPAMTGGALVLLAQQPREHATEIVAGARWLASAQHADGTFERDWSLAENCGISRAVHGLSAARDHVPLPPPVAHAVDHALDAAARFLDGSQNQDGGWGHRAGRASDPISTGYALAALGRLRRLSRVPSAVDYLTALQRPDGGFDAPPDTTAPRPIPLDVPVLAPAYVLRGLAYCER